MVVEKIFERLFEILECHPWAMDAETCITEIHASAGDGITIDADTWNEEAYQVGLDDGYDKGHADGFNECKDIYDIREGLTYE